MRLALRALGTTLMLIVLIAIGAVGIYIYRLRTVDQRRIEELTQIVKRLETDTRRAKILVTDQKTVSGKLRTTLLFVEYGKNDQPYPAREFTIDGDEAHFDAEVVKFKDDFVQQGDPLRGHAIMLFVRVYGADQAPQDGFPIDTPGTAPDPYRDAADQNNEFEQNIWKNFWELYNDRDARQVQGIRGMNGMGLYGKFELDHLYTIIVRADGDGTIQEEPVDPIYKEALQRRGE